MDSNVSYESLIKQDNADKLTTSPKYQQVALLGFYIFSLGDVIAVRDRNTRSYIALSPDNMFARFLGEFLRGTTTVMAGHCKYGRSHTRTRVSLQHYWLDLSFSIFDKFSSCQSTPFSLGCHWASLSFE
eukprot:Blabericola_migrator_1__3828@NODE_2152_length_3198_cov_79_152986_g1361_i0_p3_GENE_NODE_2152_length_3198_cov_79_152986_g1361_i0NODE_2152_length_3198_cov_79_152986_g1361_i0_p3_ORF_typecomplete_len129_score5_72_NODE_2152_length_3198_cov_79_152986_g1361_i07111097